MIHPGESQMTYALVTYRLENCLRGGLRRTEMQGTGSEIREQVW
jgi:hypothetical protein